tara:strand:+ start:773 stop:985 length:213 start_codon:yes stop_codon:yes gene_type:complete
LISPYKCPNVKGPVPNSTSEYVGLNLEEIIAQSSDLFNIKDIMLTTPNIQEKKVLLLKLKLKYSKKLEVS